MGWTQHDLMRLVDVIRGYKGLRRSVSLSAGLVLDHSLLGCDGAVSKYLEVELEARSRCPCL